MSWIGCQLRITRDGVIALLPAEVVEQLQQMINSILCAIVVSLRKLWPLAGKLSNAARVLTAWCPFFGEFWAAKHLQARSGFGHWRPHFIGSLLFSEATVCLSQGRSCSRHLYSQLHNLRDRRVFVELGRSAHRRLCRHELHQRTCVKDNINVLGAKVGSATCPASRRSIGHACIFAPVGKQMAAMEVSGRSSWRQRHNVGRALPM